MPTLGPTPPYDDPSLNIESPLVHELENDYHDISSTYEEIQIHKEEETIYLEPAALEPAERLKRSTVASGVNYNNLYKGKVIKDSMTDQL